MLLIDDFARHAGHGDILREQFLAVGTTRSAQSLPVGEPSEVTTDGERTDRVNPT
ncbi:DUF664 domain-containing protein [Amycolatopsis sp. QT-25]|nr:DUF664 domain-containing protein [Amycolatopsis sp. QT-25]WET83240.1 DUF664 domain-containing protein [Amycolatopsis sp. QT-25]